MQHPVIISSGQILTNSSMVPNYALSSLITDWCQKNKILPPDGDTTITDCPTITDSPCLTDVEYVMIETYIGQLNSHDQMVQQKGAANISLFSRRNDQVHAQFGYTGAIPSLTRLMKSTDPVTQDFAMRAILNLSVYDETLKFIVSAGAINETINVMRTGSLEARELGAAILNKRKLLVDLLGKGSERGQRDATCALYNLCSVSSNKKKAVYSGVIAKLMIYGRNPHIPLIHEALKLLDMTVSNNKDAQKALYAEDFWSHLVTIILTGSQMNQENAVLVLRQLCSRHEKLLEQATNSLLGDYLYDMLKCGSDKGRREATEMSNMILAHRERYWAEMDSGSESSPECRSKRIRSQ